MHKTGRAALAALMTCGAGLGAVLAVAQTVTLPDVPAALNPGALKPYLAANAKGVQIYACAKADSGNWGWAFKSPEAELSDPAGKHIGKHYAGPSWEGTDGGKVVGAVKASADAPSPNAIAWLLLDIKSREGNGQFTQATGILRLATVGGKAPAAGCDEPRAGSELRVPYTATYYFLK